MIETSSMESGNCALAGLDNEAYHDSPAIGASGLKRLQVSPLHYWADYLDPDRVRIDKRAFRFGRAWHCQVFEPGEFARRYVADHTASKLTTRAKVLAELLALPEAAAGSQLERIKGVPDDIKATTKEGKQLYAELEAQGLRPMPESDADWIEAELLRMHGKDVLSADDTQRVTRMAEVARRMPISRVVFEQMAAHGRAEVSMFIADPTSGVRLKIRPDYMLEPCAAFPHGLIIDGKTTTDASVAGFGRQVWNLDYGFQAALYPLVFREIYQTKELPAFLWLAQEKDAPHAARYYAAGQDLQAHYSRKIGRLLLLLAECHRTGTWPGYPETVDTLAMPAWAEKQLQDAV